jgi:hypothetical protein
MPHSPPENGETLAQDLNVQSCTHISGLVTKIAASDGPPEKAAMPAKRG